MSTAAESTVCLDIAVDHRIRRLFKPVTIYSKGSSNHLRLMEEQGRLLQRPFHEIEVTKRLAGPPIKGGIAVVLQQPRSNHPFSKGISNVIAECESLLAVHEVFRVVSCGTLDIRDNVTVIDLLPYISEKAEYVENHQLRMSFNASAQALCDKEPDVLLCAGRIWLSRTGKLDNRMGDTFRFQSIGCGRTFGSEPRYPVTARVRNNEGRLITVTRVNGFHPSFAVNYNPHVSILRQLQILNGAETCGMYRGDWENEEWMNGLRRRCQAFSESSSETSTSYPSSPQSPSRDLGKRNSNKYIPEYQDLYSNRLLELQRWAEAAIRDLNLTRLSNGELYNRILGLRLSEDCNDASLLLRQLNRLERKGWPDSVASTNEAALKEAAISTVRFVNSIETAVRNGNTSELTQIMRDGARSIRQHVDMRTNEFDTVGACEAFLALAVAIESLLMKLLTQQEDDLASMMSRIRLSV